MLTNEEKINLRLKSLELAIRYNRDMPDLDLTATAKDFYQFLSKDLEDDPLRLDVPSPAFKITTKASTNEIDWSRPQLVKSKYNDCVVKTNGIHRDGGFDGVVVVAGNNGANPLGEDHHGWVKGCFVYHGEIPKEQSEEPKTTGLNFLEAMKLCKEGKNVRRSVWPSGSYIGESVGSVYKLITGDGDEFHTSDLRNFLATDWQIVNH